MSDKSFLVGITAHFIDAGIDTGPIIMQVYLILPLWLKGITIQY